MIRKCKLLILFQEIQPLKLLKPDVITYNSLDVFWITHTDEMLSMEMKFTGFMHVVLKVSVMKIFKTKKGFSSANIEYQML